MAESSWWDTAYDWLGNNWQGVASAGLGAYNVYNKTKAENAYNDYLKQAEQVNADQTNAYNNWQAQQGQAEYGTQSANAAMMAANQAAQVAAMQQNEANRLKASKRANKYSKTLYKKLLKMYEPYKKTADMLLPQMTQTYQNSLGLQNAMGQYVQSPQQLAKLDASVPAYNINIPLPDSVRIK